MAVTIQYLVVRNGIEKMTFTNKKEADAYDRLLDLAEHLDDVLADAPISLNETDREALALYLAQNQDLLSGPKKKSAKKSDKAPATEANIEEQADEPEVHDNNDSVQAVA
ncbi:MULTISPECIES: YebG family protein [Oceanisphaera]|uniref:YebG family protein n=1 Tax=Oceanisphaera ostreae TaxID=914151 RepID=A0ABW3KHK2_9GAMM